VVDVDGAAEHHGFILAEAGDVAHGDALDHEVELPQLLGDGLGDLRGGAMF
jgi:ribulose kinase